MKAATINPAEVLAMSPAEAATLASGLDEANAYVLAVSVARLASRTDIGPVGTAAAKATFEAMDRPAVALAAWLAFDWQPKIDLGAMDRARSFHKALAGVVLAAFGLPFGAAGIGRHSSLDPRVGFFVDHTGVLVEKLNTHFNALVADSRKRGVLLVEEVVLPPAEGPSPEMTLVARGFLAFVHGKNAERVTEADVARVASYLCWTDAEAAADANRNVEAWQARLFAAGVRLGRASPR